MHTMTAQTSPKATSLKPWRLAGLAVGILALAGCENGPQLPAFLQPKPAAESGEATAPNRSTKLVERDVEAPEVFQVTEAGLWDGRPSLGGVWVAHPDVKDPERVIIRNPGNGNFVIGALFRKERETPGPRLQVSSDAAAALGLVAGQPTNLNVTALRRAETPEVEPAMPPAETTDLATPADVTAAPLDDVAGTAAAAIDAAAPEAPPAPVAAPAPVAPEPRPAAPAPRAASALAKPFIQIGIFSVEQNARNTAATMRRAGLVPTVKQGSSSGKTFWRVVVGPATSSSERATLLETIKAQGFEDAYAVTN